MCLLNSLDSEQWLKSKDSNNSDKTSSKNEALNAVTFSRWKFTKYLFFEIWM